MSDKNMAKDWQREWYHTFVGDNEVIAKTTRNGKFYRCSAKCHPDDKFSLSEGVRIATERLEKEFNPNNIKVGDVVYVKDAECVYPWNEGWVIKNVKDIRDIAKWRYNVVSANIPRDMSYTVKYVAPLNLADSRILVFISGKDGCYLYNIEALGKINE